MKDMFQGQIEIVELTGASGAETLDFRPAAHYAYKVIDAWGYCDENQALQWTYVDARNTATITKDATSRNANVAHPLYDAGVPECLLLDRDFYLRLTGAAVTAGKYLYIKAVVMKWIQS